LFFPPGLLLSHSPCCEGTDSTGIQQGKLQRPDHSTQSPWTKGIWGPVEVQMTCEDPGQSLLGPFRQYSSDSRYSLATGTWLGKTGAAQSSSRDSGSSALTRLCHPGPSLSKRTTQKSIRHHREAFLCWEVSEALRLQWMLALCPDILPTTPRVCPTFPPCTQSGCPMLFSAWSQTGCFFLLPN
jgi:hypothetical protein